MKKLFTAITMLGLVALTQPAFAAYSIKSSAYSLDFNLRLYEVCGKVTSDANEPVGGLLLDMKTDSGKNEGHYVTTSNTAGSFCQIVRVIGNQFDISLQATTATPLVTTSVKVR